MNLYFKTTTLRTSLLTESALYTYNLYFLRTMPCVNISPAHLHVSTSAHVRLDLPLLVDSISRQSDEFL